MRHLFLFEKFIEKKKNTLVIYEDNDLTIKLVKTLDSSIKNSDPQWCSTKSSGFYLHNLTANMFRFIFSDGYKLRLTWDYTPGGTSWGQGGKIDGSLAFYYNIRPENEDNPFEFDYHKNDGRQYMVDRITKIPKSAIDAVTKYHKDNEREKTALYNNIYKEIEKIKIIDVKDNQSYRKKFGYHTYYIVTVLYNNKKYEIPCVELEFRFYESPFNKEFKNKYAFSEINSISSFLIEKMIEWLKKNNIYEYNNFKNKYKRLK